MNPAVPPARLPRSSTGVYLRLAAAVLLAAGSPGAISAGEASWSRLAPLPDPLGVASPFAGVSGGALLVAGGANFPDKMPWEGGEKVWHDRVWVLEQAGATWKEAGALPRPLAYGVAVTLKNKLFCLGGSDATRHHSSVFALEWKNGKLTAISQAPLPLPLAQAAGAVDDQDTVYLACGSSAPGEQQASNRVFCLRSGDPSPAWQELPPLPAEPRILPVAAAAGRSFYLFGGTALESSQGKIARRPLRDAWHYTPTDGWKRLADLPKPCVAAPSPAPVVRKGNHDGVLLLAGDDGSLADFQPVEQHPGFPDTVLWYDFTADHWEASGKVPAPRATVPCVKWGQSFIIPSGEVRPGVRSPEVWALRDPSPPEAVPEEPPGLPKP